MAKSFKFVGEPGEKLHTEDIEHIAFDLDFSAGKPVEVTDKAVIEKLSNNSHYEEVKKAKEPVEKTPSQMNKTELEAHATGKGFTLKDGTKAEMLAELAELEAKAK